MALAISAARTGLFEGGLSHQGRSSPPSPQGGPFAAYSFPHSLPKVEQLDSPPTQYNRPIYQQDNFDQPDNQPSPRTSPQRQQPATSPNSGQPSKYDNNATPTQYHHDPNHYDFPGPSSHQVGQEPVRPASAAANFDQLRHAIASAQSDVARGYSTLGRQVVLNGEGRLSGYEYDYHEPPTPPAHYQPYPAHLAHSFASTANHQPLHPLQQQAPTGYIYGQPTHRPVYVQQDDYGQPGAGGGWGEEYNSPIVETRSVWGEGPGYHHHPESNASHLAPLPPLPEHHPFAPPALRPAPYHHVYTPYTMPIPDRGHVGGRDGWGVPEPLPAHYPPYSAHYQHDSSHHHPGPGPAGIDPVYVNPSAYSNRNSPYHRYSVSPEPTRTSTRKSAKPRSSLTAGGAPKPRQKSVIFHPTPQSMLAPELRHGSALIPRGVRDNTPHLGTNAPALPDDATFKTMMTKRSRGRRPGAQRELLAADPDEEDPNLNPTAAQIAYCGLTKTGKPKKIFVCKVPQCGKCFKRSEHLKRHVRSIHTNERPFQCQWPSCQRYFSRHDNLNQHLRVHRLPDQTDEEFSAALEHCFGAYHENTGYHIRYGKPTYESDEDELESPGPSEEGRAAYAEQ